MKHGYTNHTEQRDFVVRKTYTGPGAQQRQSAEQRALTGLFGEFPVPQLVTSAPGWIETDFVAGRHGQDLIDDGEATLVLSECGRLLADLAWCEWIVRMHHPGSRRLAGRVLRRVRVSAALDRPAA